MQLLISRIRRLLLTVVRLL